MQRDVTVFLGLLGRAAVVATALVPIILLGAWWSVVNHSSGPTDYHFFGVSGAAALTGDLANVFSDRLVQAGILAIIPYGIAYLVDITTNTGWFVFYAVMGWVLSAAGATALLCSIPRWRSRRSQLMVAIAIALGLVSTAIPYAIASGHIAHVTIPVLWVLAGVAARRKSPLLAGALIAAATGFETWGALGAAMLLLLPIARMWRAALSAAIVVALLYGPFLAVSGLDMFSMTWAISPGTVPGILFPALENMTWSLRVAQGAAAIAAGAAVAILARRTWEVIWLGPLAVIGARLVLDPMLLSYYYVSAGFVVIGLAAIFMARGARLLAGIGTVFAFVIWVPMPTHYPLLGAFLILALAVIAVIVAIWRNRNSSTQVASSLRASQP